MFRSFVSGLALATLMCGAAIAETFEIQMLNKGTDGERMVFEPDFVRAAPGDTIKFIAADKGHNAEIASGMMPDGAEAFKGKINEEVEVTMDVEGVYGVICKPHYAMGMVMTVVVGEAAVPDDFFAGRVPPKAKQRFDAQIEEL